MANIEGCAYCGSKNLHAYMFPGTFSCIYDCMDCGHRFPVPLIFDSEKDRLKYAKEKAKRIIT
jgi:DNA-directed RNA polymerase subunit RPC12/RpoP